MTYTSSNSGFTKGLFEELILKRTKCRAFTQSNQEIKQTSETIMPKRLSSVSAVSKSSIVNPELSSVSEVQAQAQC
jgi:hypothetical protein